MIKIAVAGAAGRMGKRIIANVCADPETELSGALEAPATPMLGQDACELAGCEALGVKITDVAEKVVKGCDVLIAFTLPEATFSLLQAVAAAGRPMVIGTTGHSEEQRVKIDELSTKVPVVMAPNMSVGVNVMWKNIAEAAKALGTGFEVKVSETHHIHKKDKPSGTALENVRVLAEALGVSADKIPVEAFREGEVVGNHTTLFSGPGETLEVTHRVTSRDIFALGAIRAAKWIIGKSPGLYNMQDVLGL